MRKLTWTALLLAAGCGCGCASSDATEEPTAATETTTVGGEMEAAEGPYAGPIAADADASVGNGVWEQYCNGCHPGGDEGVGPAVNGIAWTPEAMRKQIREGEDRMPAFGPDKISDADLESLLLAMVDMGGVAP